VIKDLTGNDEYCPDDKDKILREMTEDGATITSSAAVLRGLHKSAPRHEGPSS
jgi:hypothetical protein